MVIETISWTFLKWSFVLEVHRNVRWWYFVQETCYIRHSRIDVNSVESCSVVAMAGQTKLFHSLRQYYQLLGVYSPETNQTDPCHWKVIFIASSMMLTFIASFAFFLWKAETVDDYGTSFYNASSQLSQSCCFLIAVWKISATLELYKKFEHFIESS